MAIEPRVASLQNDQQALQRRVEHLERTIAGGTVDLEARAAINAAAVSTKNRVWRQAEPPVDDGTFTSGDIWFDTDNLNAPYVWQRVSGQVVTDGTSAKQGVVTTAGATGKLQKVTLAASTPYYLTVKVRYKQGAAVYFDVRDEVNNVTVTAPGSVIDDAWTELATQITTGAALPTLMAAVRTDAADPTQSAFLADSLTLATTPGGANLLPNGGFEEGLGNWTTTGAPLVNPGATLEFNRDDVYAGAWVNAQDTAFLEASGNRIFRQTTAPTVAGVGAIKDGDLWFDTDDQNRPWVWENGAWVTVRDDKIQDALNAAGLAQTTANGKNKIYVQNTSPPTTPRVVGDYWIDTGNQNRIMTWDGSGAWVLKPLGAAGISSVSATVITGQLIAGQIATGAIIADKIDAGAVTANAMNADAMTAKNFYTDVYGLNRIIMGKTAYVGGSTPRIVFDVAGTGPSALSPSIRGATTGLVIHSGNNGNSYTEIQMSPSLGQTDRITMNTYNTSGGRTYAELDASFNRFNVSGAFLAGGDVATGTSSYFVMGSSTYLATVGSPVNLHVVPGTDGTKPYAIRRTTASSRAYKQDIAALAEDDLDPARLYELPVRQFRFRDGYLDVNDDWVGRLLPGFIAQEVAEVYPAAASLARGEPEDWNPRTLIPPLLALIQQQHARITALENR